MGHENLPTGDAVALGQRKSDAVDIFLQCPSQTCINHREGKEEKHMTLISRESIHQDCSPAKGDVASAVPHKTLHSNSGKVHPRDFNAHSSLWCVAIDPGIIQINGPQTRVIRHSSGNTWQFCLETFFIVMVGEEKEKEAGIQWAEVREAADQPTMHRTVFL